MNNISILAAFAPHENFQKIDFQLIIKNSLFWQTGSRRLLTVGKFYNPPDAIKKRFGKVHRFPRLYFNDDFQSVVKNFSPNEVVFSKNNRAVGS